MELTVFFDCDDGTLSEDSPLSKWGPIQLAASEKMGKTFAVYEHVKDRIIDAGFVDVKEHKFKLPVGPWSSDKKMKEIGNWNLFFFLRDTEAFCIYLLGTIMGVSIYLLLSRQKGHLLVIFKYTLTGHSGTTPQFKHGLVKYRLQ